MTRIFDEAASRRSWLSARHWQYLTLGLGLSWLLLAWAAFNTTSRLTQELKLVAHTHEVLATIYGVQAYITDVETAQRGFLIAGNRVFLDPWERGVNRAPERLAELDELTVENPVQQARVRNLRPLLEKRLQLSRYTLELQAQQGVRAAQAFVRLGQGRQLHDQIRDLLEVMKADEEALLVERAASANNRHSFLNISLAAALILLAFGIAISTALGRACQRAEERVAASEARYRELFEASPLPTWVIDIDRGTILVANDAAVERYGYSHREMVSLGIEDLFMPEELDRVRAAIEQIHAQQPSEPSLWRQRTKDGREVIARLTSRRVKVAGHNARLIHAVDETERERAMKELRASEARFEQVFNLQFQLLATLAPDGSIHKCNQRFMEAMGRDRLGLTGVHIASLGIWEGRNDRDMGGVARRVDQAMKSRTPVYFEAGLQDAHGRPRLYLVSLRPVERADGEIEYLIFQGRDITEQAAAMEALATSERRLLSAQERAGICNWEFDLRGSAMWWSRNAAPMLGVSEADLPAADGEIGKLAHPDDRAGVAELLDQMPGTIGVATIRFRGNAEYARDRHYEMVVECLRDERGRAKQLVGGILDISDRLSLERRVHQSQRLEAVGKLTGGVAHDFNNLLTVVIGNSEVLVDEIADPELRELADLSLSAASRGADLTSRLLAFARRQPLEPVVVQPGQLVADMHRLIRQSVAKEIDIELVTTAATWKTFVDPAQLESAILNLAINAREAMPNNGKLTIEVSNVQLDAAYAAAHADVVAGSYVLIAVSDTGSGIPVDLVDRVFEPFFTTKERGDNSGLGLSMVHGFVKQSGGHVKIYSETGVGTTIRIYLPRYSGGEVLQHVSEPVEPIRGGTERILIVEDDDLVRRHVATQLAGMGYRVATAENAETALVIFQTDQDFDLIFTDVVMPGGINGRELARKIREMKPDIPILFTSGYTENAIVHHGRLDSGVHLLSKPYRLATLASKVRRAIDQPSERL